VSDLPKTQELILAIRNSDLVLPREGAIAITALETAMRLHHEMVKVDMLHENEMRRVVGGQMVIAKVWAGVAIGGEDLWFDVAEELLPEA